MGHYRTLLLSNELFNCIYKTAKTDTANRNENEITINFSSVQHPANRNNFMDNWLLSMQRKRNRFKTLSKNIRIDTGQRTNRTNNAQDKLHTGQRTQRKITYRTNDTQDK